MRRMFSVGVALVSLVVMTGCPGPQPGGDPYAPWKADLEHVTPASSPPPLIRTVLNTAIRTGVPVACPALAAQAAPEYRTFVTANVRVDRGEQRPLHDGDPGAAGTVRG